MVIDENEKPYPEETSYRILNERRSWLRRLAEAAQAAYQSISRLPANRREALEQEKYVAEALDRQRMLAYEDQNKLKNERL